MAPFNQTVFILLCCFNIHTSIFAVLLKEDTYMSKKELVDILQANNEYLCPYADVCGKNKTDIKAQRRKLVDYVPCCADCACYSECTEGECCFREEGREWGPSELCVYTNSRQLAHDGKNRLPAYRMVTKCPQMDINGILDCRDYNESAWGYLNPVFSYSDKRIYLNEQCAQCNGLDTDFERWDTYIGCSFKYNSFGLNQLNKGLQNNYLIPECFAFFYINDINIDLQIKQCSRNPINKCEVFPSEISSDIHLNTSEIVRACDSNFYSLFVHGTDVYKNVFCYLCSGDHVAKYFSRNKMCPDPTFVIRTGVTMFTTILSGKHGHFTPLANRAACREHLNGSRICKPVHCPIGEEYRGYQRCEVFMQIWLKTRFMLFVMLNATSFSNRSVWMESLTNKNVYRNKFDIIKPLPEWSVSSVYIDDEVAHTENTVFYVVLELEEKKTDFQRLKTSVHQALREEWTVLLETDVITCTAKHLPFLTDSLHRKSDDFLKFEFDWMNSFNEDLLSGMLSSKTLSLYQTSSLFEKPFIQLTKLYFCKQIEFVSSEIDLLSENRVLYLIDEDKFLFDGEFTVHLTNDAGITARVCLHDTSYTIGEVEDESHNPISCASFFGITLGLWIPLSTGIIIISSTLIRG